MVTYGPWQEPVTYTETWRWGESESVAGEITLVEHTIDPVPVQFGEPMTKNQWVAAGGFTPNGDMAIVSGFGNEGRIFVPSAVPPYKEDDYGTDVPSKEAWSTAVSDDRVGFGGGVVRLTYAGGIAAILPSGFQHSEVWTAAALEAQPEFSPRSGSTNFSALAGIPSQRPPGVAYGEVDPTRGGYSNFSLSESMRLEFDLGASAPGWEVAVKDLDGSPAGWFLASEERNVTTGRIGTYLGRGGTYDFDMTKVPQWRQDWEPFPYQHPVAGLPEFALVWTAGWPGNFLGAAPFEYAVIDPSIVITYTWSAPRWRWVYYDVAVPDAVPYRRVYPRDDGLAGGAPRVHPPSRAIQSSRRIRGPGSIQ